MIIELGEKKVLKIKLGKETEGSHKYLLLSL